MWFFAHCQGSDFEQLRELDGIGWSVVFESTAGDLWLGTLFFAFHRTFGQLGLGISPASVSSVTNQRTTKSRFFSWRFTLPAAWLDSQPSSDALWDSSASIIFILLNLNLSQLYSLNVCSFTNFWHLLTMTSKQLRYESTMAVSKCNFGFFSITTSTAWLSLPSTTSAAPHRSLRGHPWPRASNGLRGCGAMMRRMPLPSSENSSSSSEPRRNHIHRLIARAMLIWGSHEPWYLLGRNQNVTYQKCLAMALWLVETLMGCRFRTNLTSLRMNMDPELLPRHPCRTTGLSVSDGKREATADEVPVDPAFFHGCCLFNCRNRLHSLWFGRYGLVLKENLHQKLCLFYGFPMIFHVCFPKIY